MDLQPTLQPNVKNNCNDLFKNKLMFLMILKMKHTMQLLYQA